MNEKPNPPLGWMVGAYFNDTQVNELANRMAQDTVNYVNWVA